MSAARAAPTPTSASTRRRLFMRNRGFRHEAVCEGEAFVALVAETGMSYQHIADEFGVSCRTLESWIYGKTPTPKIAILAIKHLACDDPQKANAADDSRSFST